LVTSSSGGVKKFFDREGKDLKEGKRQKNHEKEHWPGGETETSGANAWRGGLTRRGRPIERKKVDRVWGTIKKESKTGPTRIRKGL